MDLKKRSLIKIKMSFRKMVLFFSICFFSIGLTIHAQTYTGNIEIKSQKEIDEVFSKGGVLYNISTIDGHLLIGERGEETDITSLAAFSKIKTITEGLYIFSNLKLTSLKGLESITSLPIIYISVNTSLENLEGLKNLRKVTGIFRIAHNTSLISLKGLNSLDSVGELDISSNDNLKSFKGIEKLKKVEALNIMYHKNLLSIADLQLKIASSLSFMGNEKLENFKGLESIKKTSMIVITGNKSLTTLKGLDNLTLISKGIFVRGNHQLTSFYGLHKLKEILVYLDVTENKKLASFEGLEKLNKIGGELYVERNSELKTLNGFENLKSIGSLRIQYNSELEDFCAIKNVVKEFEKKEELKKSFNIRRNYFNPNIMDLKNSKCTKKRIE